MSVTHPMIYKAVNLFSVDKYKGEEDKTLTRLAEHTHSDVFKVLQ